MNKLILIGGGGHCKSCIDVIEQEGKYQIIGILDSKDKSGGKVLSYDVIGTDDDIRKYILDDCYFLITVGQIKTYKTRKKIYLKLQLEQAKFATVVSPRAYVSKYASIGSGTIIMHDSVINADAIIQENCIINTKAIIEHDSIIEAHCHISTAAVINGEVTVSKGSFFGSNAVSKQGVTTKKADFVKAGSCYLGSNKKRKKVAFLTTIFPMCDSYVHDFFQSLSEQTWHKFDLIVLNDGFGDLKYIKEKYTNLNIIELPTAYSIAKNRESLIKYAFSNAYDIAIFGDSDDYFSKKRIELSLSFLLKNDIVVNDLTTFSNNEILDKNVFSNRLKNLSNIEVDYIKDKNVFGLSNTAINLKILHDSRIFFENDLIAVDWYFFTCLLLKGAKAIFTNEFSTFYRQHDNNTVGLGTITEESIIRTLKVKLIHYKNIISESSNYIDEHDKTKKLLKLVSDDSNMQAIYIKNKQKLTSSLWWELID